MSDPGSDPPPVPQAPTPTTPADRSRSPYGAAPAPSRHTPAPQIPGAPGMPAMGAFPQVVRAPVDVVSLLGVIAGALTLGPVALVLGLVGVRRTRGGRRRSPALAWTGVGLGIVTTLAWATAVTLVTLSGSLAQPGPGPGDVEAPVTVDGAALSRGNCVAHLPPAGQIGEVTVVPCADEHQAQVVTVADLPGAGGDYPGEAAVAAQGQEVCLGPADAVAGSRDGIEPTWLVPSAGAWSQGTQVAVCLVRTTAGPLTGSVLD